MAVLRSTHNLSFGTKIRRIGIPYKPQFCYIKVGYEGVNFLWTCFPDVVTDDTSSDCHYVDLLLNPERYTGYKGKSAHRIWNSIYKENCFK